MPVARLLVSPRTYSVWLAFVVVAYVATCLIDPYLFGFTFLGLGAASAVVAVCGVVGWLAERRSTDAGAGGRVRLLTALIVVANVAAFAVLRSISWA